MQELITDSREFSKDPKNTFGGFSNVQGALQEVETDGENPQHSGIINNFANYLLGLEELFVEGTEGINGVELMNAIELSGFLGGEEVTLPIDGDKYLEILNQKRKTSRRKEEVESKAQNTAGTY